MRMSKERGRESARSLTFVGALLVTTAITGPAAAQIETVVVTAERKTEDIQNVPVSVTALTTKDLKAKQINTFRDLQFHVPSVTYTKSNYGGAQFQIRGISTQFGLGAAVAQNLDDIYLEAPNLVSSEYYDVDRVEVARGPQSTSYGRAATGGAVNVITSKPDLEDFHARASIDYGSFEEIRPDAMINVPIIDGELGFRLAFHGLFHDGFEKNAYSGPEIYPTQHIESRLNDQETMGARASIRWQPSQDTTIDIVADAGVENDNRVRGDKQECHRDPSGVVGCLPDKLGFDPLNVFAALGATLPSRQGITALLSTGVICGVLAPGSTPATPGGCGTAASGLLPVSLPSIPSLGLNGFVPGDPAYNAAFQAAQGYGNELGLFSLSGTPQSPGSNNPAQGFNPPGSGFDATGAAVPHDLLTIQTPFTPKYKTGGQIVLMNWKQKLADWLSGSFDVGYTSGYQFTQQAYNDLPVENISSEVHAAVTNLNALSLAGDGPAAMATYDSVYFNKDGYLPYSNTHYRGLFGSYGGVIDYTRGGILTKTNQNTAYDEDAFGEVEKTGELRLQTSFKGPLNFSAGFFYMGFRGRNQYWVAAPLLDWTAIAIGTLQGLGSNTAKVDALPAFVAEVRHGDVQSRSAFLEGTYEIVPDELKTTVGVRFNDDRQSALANAVGLLTLGAFNVGATNVNLPVTFRYPYDAGTFCTSLNPPTPAGCSPYNHRKHVITTDLITGRALIEWTPKLDWTTQTNIYFVASRGELAGGINAANASEIGVAPTVFKPATVDALELGLKNTLLDGTLTANLTAWYYNYENYQVGIIANRAALTFNVPARLDGLEGEFLWAPSQDLAFNATISLTQSHAGKIFIVDQRNLTGGSPNAILIKDLITGSNCVIVPITPQAAGHTPGESSLTSPFHVDNFYLPLGGDAAVDAPFGIPLVNYGVCQPGLTGKPTPAQVALENAGFDYSQSTDLRTGQPLTSGPLLRDGLGIPKPLYGHQLPQVPYGQVGVGAQYTFHLDELTLVPRVDYYWQSSMWSRVWNDPIVDRVNAWDVMNAQVQLNGEESRWFVKAFATNVFDKKNPTGAYLTDASSGLWTNIFAEDPRIVGFSLGANW
jgi:outer membrane receptor protein involved in Fe transport